MKIIQIALFQPEIPPNTGNIIRLCANAGFQLHLIHPLGFEFDDKRLRRAGLDYHEFAQVIHHHDYAAFVQAVSPARIIACETCGEVSYSDFQYQTGDVILMGRETLGLPQEVLAALPAEHIVKIPMQANSRSINLSNATAIIVYEAWRQLGFDLA